MADEADASKRLRKEKKTVRKKERKERREDRKRMKRNTPAATVKSASSSSSDEEAYGPQVPFSHTLAAAAALPPPTSYGSGLFKGEGAALAEFAKRNERIPRRGEVGYDGDTIEKFEALGYVMSGSRHSRMEAVRKRKENQIISAEEKRLMVINETKTREDKEARVLEEMRHLIQKKEREEAANSLG